MQRPSARKLHDDILQTLRAYQVAVNEATIVSITDLKGNIIYVNQHFIEVSKYSEDELIGQNHRIINSGYHDKSYFRQMWEKIGSGQSWRGEIKNKAKDGSYYWVDTVITPILDKQGKIFQYLSLRNLITTQKENEERLLASQQVIIKREKQLNLAQQVSKTGSWVLTVPDNNRLEWSLETYHIFEVEPGTEMTYEKFLEMVHPDDRKFVHNNWQEALTTGLYHIEHRIVTKHAEKWVSERAHFEFDKTSNLTSALGTVQDITEIKKIEESLRESKKLYKTLFNTSPFAVGIVDKTTHQFLEVNDTAISLYGYSREEFMQLTLFDIRVTEEHEKMRMQLFGERYAGDNSIRCHRKKNGEILFIEPSITTMHYKGRQVYLITINDITLKLKFEEELIQAEHNRQKDIIEAEENSRSQIGMELHDNVNQLLVASRLYLQRIQTSPDQSPYLLQTALDILGDALDEIRKLSATLVTPLLSNNNLKELIEDLLKNYTLFNAAIELKIDIKENTIPQGLKTNIYRIIQEQISNITKYAGATKINVSLLQNDSFIDLYIADNGKGFDLKQSKKGIGLSNIMYRTKAYSGKFSIDTEINKGCK